MTNLNAPCPLKVGHELGHVQHVHPDVVHIPGGFQGYPYWMVFTPYPFANDRWENPVVRVSQDGYRWERFPELADPVVPPPSDAHYHHADTELVYAEGVLYLVYMTARKGTGETVFSVIQTTTGSQWSHPQAFQSGRFEACPSLVVEGRQWKMWMVTLDPTAQEEGSKIYVRSGADLFHLDRPETCSLDIPGHVPWHVDVQPTGSGYEMLVAAFPEGSDNSRTRLFLLHSGDGRSFVLNPRRPLLKPSIWRWDNRMIYRSCFLKAPDGQYRIWYSAASWSLRFGLGYLEGPLGDLRPSARCETACLSFWHDVIPGFSKWSRFWFKRCMPDFVVRMVKFILSALRTQTESGK